MLIMYEKYFIFIVDEKKKRMYSIVPVEGAKKFAIVQLNIFISRKVLTLSQWDGIL